MVSVDTLGAELSSIRTLRDDHEYLWQGDTASWKNSSPVLFPIIGSLVDDRFTYDGKSYSMPSHGFARHREFRVIEQNPESVTYELIADEESLRSFPFRSSLRIQYALSDNRISVTYRLKGEEKHDLLFSIGGHPGFNCPMEPDFQYVFQV